jgi:hypothetical protein
MPGTISPVRSRVLVAFVLVVAALAAVALYGASLAGSEPAVSSEARPAEALEPVLATAERVFKQTAPFDEVAPRGRT